MRWRLDDLSLFCAIVEAGGVSAAAVALDLPKSTLSKGLARLEADLGLQLIERTSRRMRITPEGDAFHARASAILDLAREADTMMQSLRAVPSGRVRLAVPTAFCREILAPRLPDFAARYPAIELEILAGLPSADLWSGACDLAVVVGVQPDSTLSQKVLAGGRLIWIASPAYVAAHAIGDAPDFRHVGICETRYGAAPLELPAHVMRVNDPLSVRAAVVAGMGVSFLPERYCVEALRSGALVEVWHQARFDHAAARLAVVYASQRLLSPRFRAVVSFLEEICP
jgi:LysR family transcriptional regulator, regulator for bpeEF and oprC